MANEANLPISVTLNNVDFVGLWKATKLEFTVLPKASRLYLSRMTSRSPKSRRRKSAHPPRPAMGRAFPLLLGFLAVFTVGLIVFAFGVIFGLISF
jgi:hypothetical protein